MTILFERPTSVETSFAIKTDPERGGSDTILLSNDVWHRLCLRHVHPPSRIAVSLSPRLHGHTLSMISPLRAIVCWAILDDEIADLCIPPRWLQTYPHLFRFNIARPSSSQNYIIVTATDPINLTSVVLTALGEEAFHAGKVPGSFLQKWLTSDYPIFRQGDVHVLKAEFVGCPAYHYRVEMVEPIDQGCIDLAKTQLVLTLGDPSAQEDMVPLKSAVVEDDATEKDMDGIEIDEDFFARSVFPLQSDRSRGQNLKVSGEEDESSIYPSVNFFVESSSHPISDQDDYTLYLRTSDLSRVGILNEDWAVARSENATSSRLVRIVANDDLVPSVGVVMGSPTLLHNLRLVDTPPSKSILSLHGIPVVMGRPPIPTARSVTLTIVASPFSGEEPYRTFFVEALKNRLEGTEHLIKPGDIICVGIDSSALRSQELLHGCTVEEGWTNFVGSTSPRTSLTAFFVINDIHLDASSATSFTQKVTKICASGDLGCWSNYSVTRVTQTGEIRCRIPDMQTYLGADQQSPTHIYDTLRNMSSPALLSSQSAFGQLFALATAATSRHAVDYGLRFSILLKGKRGVGKFTTIAWVAQTLGFHVFEVNCYRLIGKDDVKTRDAIKAQFRKAPTYAPCCLILRHLDALTQSTQNAEKESVTLVTILQESITDLAAEWKKTGLPILVLGIWNEVGSLPFGIQSCFKHELVFEAPGEAERFEILKCLLASALLAPNVSLSDLATRTAAFVASDLANLVECTKLNSVRRVRGPSHGSGRHYVHDEIPLTRNDFDKSLAKVRASYSDSIGAPKIPDVSWDDVGGLGHVKHDILETVQLPLDHPELFSDGLKKRSGILLYGPPGTGKTLLAKAVATSCSLNFLSVKGPELLNMYIGESEANVRRVFQQAREAKPCVIFFDELDSVAPKRGNHGDSGGVMDRIVSQLLAELDGMASGKAGDDIFVIGATNRPDLLDTALLRPGRFDRMLYLGVSSTHEDQLHILQALTRKFSLEPEVELSAIAEKCPFHFTGADFYALCSDAMLAAMSRKALDLERKIDELNRSPHMLEHPVPLTSQYYLAELATPEDLRVQVTQSDFESALRNLVPSISQSELDHYLNIQTKFSNSAVIDVGDSSAV